jgi:tetratricopeptide (TPR) repeat protein
VVDFNLHIPANALLLAFVFGLIANPGIKYSSETARPAVNIIPQVAIALLGVILLIQSTRLFFGEYYAERARTALRDENPSAAIAFANKALVHEKQNPDIYFYLGRALCAVAHKKDRADELAPFYEGALGAFENANRLAPLDGTYPLELASTYDEVGRFAEAEGMYAVARSRDPRSTAISQLYQFHLKSWQKHEKGSASQPF